MKTILERVEKAGLEEFLVRKTDPITGESELLDMEQTPQLITEGMLIEIAPYDQAGIK